MKGIKRSDCRFYVNEEERTIVCVIPRTREMLNEFIEEHFKFDDINFWYATIMPELNLPTSFMGKAVCSKEDQWDEELGRMIAFSRAKNKCYKSFFKRANMYVQRIDRRIGDIINQFNDFGIQLEDRRAILQKNIDERIEKK